MISRQNASPLVESSAVGYILAAARTARGWSQLELASQSGVPVEIIQRLESARHIPSVLEWQKLTGSLGISMDSLEIGFLDGIQASVLRSSEMENGFALPEKFRADRCLKIRELLPYFASAIDASNWDSFTRWLDSLGFPPSFVYNLDNQVNLHFYERLVVHLFALGITDVRAGTIAEYLTGNLHGRLWEQYRTLRSSHERVRAYVQASGYYQCAFSLEILEDVSSPEEIAIKCTPFPFLARQLQSYLPETLAYLDIVREHTLLKMANSTEDFEGIARAEIWRIEETQSIYQGHDSSIYFLSRTNL